MRRTTTGLLSLAAICVAGIVMAQDEFDPFSPPVQQRSDGSPDAMEPMLTTDDSLRGGGSSFDRGGFGRGRGRIADDDLPSLLNRELTNQLNRPKQILQSQITTATRQLTSDDADERDQGRAALEGAIAALFEIRAKERQEQIEELEERIAKLRDQMERREEKKSEIIQLQVQTYVNQANGLGF